jgi:hypothetical protein
MLGIVASTTKAVARRASMRGGFVTALLNRLINTLHGAGSSPLGLLERYMKARVGYVMR